MYIGDKVRRPCKNCKEWPYIRRSRSPTIPQTIWTTRWYIYYVNHIKSRLECMCPAKNCRNLRFSTPPVFFLNYILSGASSWGPFLEQHQIPVCNIIHSIYADFLSDLYSSVLNIHPKFPSVLFCRYLCYHVMYS